MIKTLKFKVRAESYAWLNLAAMEVNQVWNWANAVSADAADRNKRANAKFLSEFDLNNLSAGATKYFEKIGADIINRVNGEYAKRRQCAKKTKLRWRKNYGSRRSLGWIPFKAVNLKRKGGSFRLLGKSFRVFEIERLKNMKWTQGCFAQDAVGDWWLCLPVEYQAEQSVAPQEAIGIDLGLKTIATTSDGETLEAGRWTQCYADKLAMAQRRGHRQQAKRIHRKISRCRKDALHKFSTRMVSQYQKIVIGDVSSAKLMKTKMAKSVADSGWYMLKTFLEYKCQQAARTFEIVNESFTTRACSSCGSLTGPTGYAGLSVRAWRCGACGTLHDRDINSAINIRQLGSRYQTPICGNELQA